ncbi:hypothetical protein BDB01DRAFT_831935 [Pilobolus umbonatus]|nr:hypothetical protein BDB01DRAFT_831935 [Pilobolus umbonatus]
MAEHFRMALEIRPHQDLKLLSSKGARDKKFFSSLYTNMNIPPIYAHLHFGTIAKSSKFFNTYAVNMNIFCPLLPIQVKPALTKGKDVLYNTIATNISGEDVPGKKVLYDTLNLASVSQQTHAEPTATTISTSTSSPTLTPTEPRPLEPTATELVLAEDKPEAAWRASLKRSIEALEVDLKQKEWEVHAIKKNYSIKRTVVILFPTLYVPGRFL